MARWPKKPYKEWNRWWAWHKVECEGMWVRWEYVERSYCYAFDIDGSGYSWWEYRFPKENTDEEAKLV